MLGGRVKDTEQKGTGHKADEDNGEDTAAPFCGIHGKTSFQIQTVCHYLYYRGTGRKSKERARAKKAPPFRCGKDGA